MTAQPQAIIYGLMLAESLSWTGLYERSHLLPFWTRRKRRDIEAQYEQDKLLEISLPFALNQPTGAFKLAPGPHSEWVAFQLQILARDHGHYKFEAAVDAWRGLAVERESLRLNVSQHAVLKNLQQGKVPPQTGYDNPHYFDDTACFRAIALAIGSSQEGLALSKLVKLDAEISNAEDGVWAAQALAASLSVALSTADPNKSIEAALALLPEGSWSHSMTTRALTVAESSESIFDLVFNLSNEIINDAYNYGNSAPEILAISLAIIRFTRGQFAESLFAALALARTAGSVAPLVGALCGALGASPQLSASLHTHMPALRGISLPTLRGVDLLSFLGDLNGFRNQEG